MLYSPRQIPDFQNILPGLADRKKTKKPSLYKKKPADNTLALGYAETETSGGRKVRVKEILCIVCPNQVA